MISERTMTGAKADSVKGGQELRWENKVGSSLGLRKIASSLKTLTNTELATQKALSNKHWGFDRAVNKLPLPALKVLLTDEVSTREKQAQDPAIWSSVQGPGHRNTARKPPLRYDLAVAGMIRDSIELGSKTPPGYSQFPLL
ncbi:hypothetical protein H920_17462 [Fukomys damarensis]|uniref:Uncharacterized protein n=1 Tax=Fukomys damarensis TaxID=885580 RepID=A0A091CPU4_FUKDA|nr:hypothetical protein H920_17462 [Fukomys damarensis]